MAIKNIKDITTTRIQHNIPPKHLEFHYQEITEVRGINRSVKSSFRLWNSNLGDYVTEEFDKDGLETRTTKCGIVYLATTLVGATEVAKIIGKEKTMFRPDTITSNEVMSLVRKIQSSVSSKDFTKLKELMDEIGKEMPEEIFNRATGSGTSSLTPRLNQRKITDPWYRRADND